MERIETLKFVTLSLIDAALTPEQMFHRFSASYDGALHVLRFADDIDAAYDQRRREVGFSILSDDLTERFAYQMNAAMKLEAIQEEEDILWGDYHDERATFWMDFDLLDAEEETNLDAVPGFHGFDMEGSPVPTHVYLTSALLGAAWEYGEMDSLGYLIENTENAAAEERYRDYWEMITGGYEYPHTCFEDVLAEVHKKLSESTFPYQRPESQIKSLAPEDGDDDGAPLSQEAMSMFPEANDPGLEEYELDFVEHDIRVNSRYEEDPSISNDDWTQVYN